MFSLVNLIVFIGLAFAASPVANSATALGILGGIIVLYAVALVLPVLAVTVRRLHDSGHSGWWYFIQYVPVIGPFVILGLLILGSDQGDNKYGPNPHIMTVQSSQVIDGSGTS